MNPFVNKRSAFLAFCVLIFLGIGSAFGHWLPIGSWRYEMTVVVETPEGIKTGSAVREISNAAPLLDLPDAGNPARINGEAVVVDLGERGLLFALISDKSDSEFYQAFPCPKGPPTKPDCIRYYKNLGSGLEATLDPTRHPGYPKFVRFRKSDDARTVQVFDRHELEEIYGQGVALTSIRIQTTKDRVTWRIDERLPLFREEDGFHAWYKSLKYGDRRQVNRSMFLRRNQ